ncbi:MAG: DEAD/DEAH box helicase [Leptonema sp. (in: bacteria)]
MNSESGSYLLENHELFDISFQETKNIRKELFPDLDNINTFDLLLAIRIFQSYKIRIQYIYNRLSSLTNSRTRLLPHQVEATYRVIKAIHHRFLIADEVGLGKTIEAGLIMKELILRKNYKNILIVVPAPLQIQWKQELANKFNEDFIILNKKNFGIIKEKSLNYKMITSIDFIKNKKISKDIYEISWDLAIFDEAHRLRRDFHKITQAYHFAENISKRVESLLLLSATPFRGKIEELYFLVKLLDPHLLGPEHSFFNEYVIPARNGETIKKIRSKIDSIIIRRRKIDVGGFTKRIAKTIKFELSTEEKIFYEETTEYVKKTYNLSQKIQNRAISFIMIVFQKLLDSSTRALLKALEKRKSILENKLLSFKSFKTDIEYDINEYIEYAENEDEILENVSNLETNYSIKEVRTEIMVLSHLIALGRKIKQDTKLIKLKETIEFLKKNGHNKIIIFTQFRTTQEYLLENLKEYKCNIFNGCLTNDQKEKEIIEFKERGEILISTEAGGEGRNLQFSDVLINYDLPWSPLKMEQRIGRIHRFGQKKDVLILNFSTKGTVAEKILDVLENKIRIFEDSIGPSDMLLGTIEEELNLSQYIMELISGSSKIEQLETNLEEKIRYIKNSYRLLEELVSPNVVDFNLSDFYKVIQEERLVTHQHIERLVLDYLNENPHSTFKLKKIKKIKNVNLYNLLPEHKIAVFDATTALENENYVFLAIGHKLVDEALEYYLNSSKKKSLIKLKINDYVKKGLYIICEIIYQNPKEKKEILIVYTKGFTNKFEISQFFPLEDFFLKPKKLKEIGLIEITNKEINSIRRVLKNMMVWLEEQIKEINSGWFSDIKELYKNEQYKLEISYGKKIRDLEERKDIERLKSKIDPTLDRKGIQTRIENAIQSTKLELAKEIRLLNKKTILKKEIEVLQIYWIV